MCGNWSVCQKGLQLTSKHISVEYKVNYSSLYMNKLWVCYVIVCCIEMVEILKYLVFDIA